MSWYRQQLEDWLKTLDVKADTVLDVGGAQGEVKSRVKSWDVKEYKVLDLPEWDLNKEYADKDNFLDVYDSADIIFCLEVFEYLIYPLMALANIETILKSGGKAYITFAFSYPHHNELELDALRYTEPGIKRLADKAGLTITNIWYRTDRSGLLRQFYAADGMHPAKEYDHHDVTGFIVEFTK
jgi:SAM-dependent methyltransferase